MPIFCSTCGTVPVEQTSLCPECKALDKDLVKIEDKICRLVCTIPTDEKSRSVAVFYTRSMIRNGKFIYPIYRSYFQARTNNIPVALVFEPETFQVDFNLLQLACSQTLQAVGKSTIGTTPLFYEHIFITTFVKPDGIRVLCEM
jgi:hypothetical protein